MPFIATSNILPTTTNVAPLCSDILGRYPNPRQAVLKRQLVW